MKETIARKRKGVAGLKEPELALAPKMRGTSVRLSSLSARYPVNVAWPAEMRIDMQAAYLDFRTCANWYALFLAAKPHRPPDIRVSGPSIEANFKAPLRRNSRR